MSISRDIIFDEDVKQQHTPVTSELVPIPDSDSDELPAAVKEEAVAAKEEAASVPEVVAKGAAEEEGHETAVATTEHRYPQRENRQAPLRFREPGLEASQESVAANLAQSSPTEEPETYEEAMQSSDANQWSLAMNEEIASLQLACKPTALGF
ncbi:hypothetical protein WJX77_011272 [Trebouxia sp. C0004]